MKCGTTIVSYFVPSLLNKMNSEKKKTKNKKKKNEKNIKKQNNATKR